MPPERLPWDRKDLRKYLRSTPRWRESSSSHYGSKYDRSTNRWRESSSSQYGSSRDFSRWGGSNEFRRPPGHGKQGGWHMFPEESGHGYAPFRSSDRMLDDKNFRSSVPRGDGKYGRNSRDRASFGQRDWRAHSWDMSNGSLNTPGRLHDLSNEQQSVDDMLTYPASHAQPEFTGSWDQLHSKEQHDNNKLDGVNGLEAGLRGDRETSLDWKPIKWARSISLSSRGSGFSNSSSSKNLGGADSNEVKAELHVKNVSAVTSPSGEAATVATSALSEEMSARKKPRLNWGEGLAKYEKKKVEGPEENVDKDAVVISNSNNEAMHLKCLNLDDNSPRVVGLSEWASPATPSSAAFSSPVAGPEDKLFDKATEVDNGAINLCGSPSTGSQSLTQSFAFNLEVLDGTSVTNLLAELLQYDDSSLDSSFVRSTVMNKLLILKDNISKTLEVTESEIDSLENELKYLNCESGSRCPCLAVSSSLSVEDDAKLCSLQVVASNNIPRPSPLRVFSSGDEHVEEVPVCNSVLDEVNCGTKVDDLDSPGTATSKFVEPLPMATAVCSPCGSGKLDECSGDANVLRSPNMESKSLMPCCRDANMVAEIKEGASVSTILTDAEDNLCNLILLANKESASRASEVFKSLLPGDQCKIDFSEISYAALQKDDAAVKEKIALRKRFMKFKERVVMLKFKAFHHLWKEDMRLLSIGKYRAKSQKKYESSLRTTQCVIQKNRSSIRLRFSSPVRNSSLTPPSEMLNFTSKLLSESQVKLYRNDLKMPALILDKRERSNSQFISRNGLVEDPWALEKERARINPWTSEEREIFIDKLATIGKDFQKIASFLDHKTTADCVEFYYKNHKSDCFQKTKKFKQGKSSTNYLVASGSNWKREMKAAASLDVIGATSFMTSDASNDSEKQQMHAGSARLAGYNDSEKLNNDARKLDQSSNFDMLENERETVAADILAGICGAISSDAMGSCITTSLDPGNSAKKRPSLSDVSQSVDEETCSDDSCGEMDPADWTDEEKCIFVQAVSSYGKDFDMISRCVRTRSRDQCKVFFSKARKCLGLDSIHTGPGNSDYGNGGGSDTEDGCALETSSLKKLHLPVSVTRLEEYGAASKNTLALDLERCDYSVAGPSDHRDSKDEKTSDSCLTENKLNSPFDCGSKVVNGFNHQSEFMQAQETSNESVSSEARREKSTEDGISAGPVLQVAEAVGYCSLNSDAVQVKEEVSACGSDDCLERKRYLFPGTNFKSSDATEILPVEDCHSGSRTGAESLHVVAVQQSPVMSQLEDKLSADSVLKPSSVLTCSLENRDAGKASVCLDDKLHPSQARSLSNSGGSSQFLSGYPFQISAKKGKNGDISLGPVGHSVFSQDCYLQKCNKSKALPEIPLLSQQSRSSSADPVKPSSNGDVKLFGKILSKPSPSPLPMPNLLDNSERGVHCVKTGSKSLNLKDNNCSSSILNFDNNCLALENVPVKSYGVWDGNKIHTGFSSIPDYFLSKYPEAFGNYHHRSSSRMEQQSLVEPSLSNVSVLSAGEISGSNGLVDYSMYRGLDSSKVQQYSVEVQQRQDIFCEMQRNGFDGISNMQQQGRIVGRGGAIAVSDPVVALKYAKTEQYGGQETWRRGDVGR